jgi:hypothetical protein
VINKGFEVVRATVAVIDVIRVLPDIDSEDRLGTRDERALPVGCFRDDKLAILDR